MGALVTDGQKVFHPRILPLADGNGAALGYIIPLLVSNFVRIARLFRPFLPEYPRSTSSKPSLRGRESEKGMGTENHLRTSIALLTAALCLLTAVPSIRADSPAVVVVPDRLCFPSDEIHIEATLYRTGLLGLFKGGIQGELLRFVDPEGNPLRDLLTDPSGSARIRYTAGPVGRYPITVRLTDNPRYSADPATGNLFVHEKNKPLFFVSVEAGLMPPISTPLLRRNPKKIASDPGSAEALSEIAACRMPVYLTQEARPSSHQTRSWLEEKGYPLGPICFLDRPLMAGILSEAPPPETGVLESIWKERSVPAHLLTRDPILAKAAAAKGIRVLLLTPETSTSGPSIQEEEETGEKGQEENIISVQEWAAIPTICPCEKENK